MGKVLSFLCSAEHRGESCNPNMSDPSRMLRTVVGG